MANTPALPNAAKLKLIADEMRKLCNRRNPPAFGIPDIMRFGSDWLHN
jgi:hypothetical protein